ncbi:MULTISPECIES: hypothetical protein [unclassified Streptomyces]|uniref:hypothetical protein n=1 Tax=unclassified Streptomyces TaxID=2593676 RepID=UPI00343C1767
MRADVHRDIQKNQDEWKREALAAFEKSGGAPVSIPVEYRAPGPPLEPGASFQNRDWYLGVGGHQRVVSGEVSVVPGADGEPKISMDYQVNIYDRYNWDGIKSTPIGPTDIKDSEMARLHTVGLAREFDMRGTSSVQKYDFDAPGAGVAPPADAGRDGTRSDPSRGEEKNR